MTNEPREVMGVSGEIAILGPNDKLIVRLPAETTPEVGREVVDHLRRTLPGRAIVFAGDVDITVARDGD